MKKGNTENNKIQDMEDMEYIFYRGYYYRELEDLLRVEFGIDEENYMTFQKDDWEDIVVQECGLEPLFELSPKSLAVDLSEVYMDRLAEDGDEYEKLVELFKKHINFDEINKGIPKLYYPNGKAITITFKDIINYFEK